MDKTKSVVKDFIGKAGHKDTTVHETINPAVQHEVVKPTRHESVNEAVQKEVHHHIHETIQPVVEKETVQPTVVHTTVPIHETHHNTAQHHATSVLPSVSMDEFKKQGGALGGREERFDAFEGEHKHVGSGHTVHRKKDSDYDEHHPPKGVFHGDVDPLDRKTRRGEQGDKTRHTTDSDTKSKQHPGLLDKLNPRTDADGDGKAGFMS
ncbi:hypothetical protein DL763_007709 [Monosporascus cannonballus]|nr:hypothetical protein DL763_007709 [Monosporascus cannonballus]